MWNLPEHPAAWTPDTRMGWRRWIAEEEGREEAVRRIIEEELNLPDDWTGPAVARIPRSARSDLEIFRDWLSGSSSTEAWALEELARRHGQQRAKDAQKKLERILQRLRVALRMDVRQPMMLVREMAGPGRDGRSSHDRSEEYYEVRRGLITAVREQLGRMEALVGGTEAHRIANEDLIYLRDRLRELVDEFPDDDDDDEE